jgi:hypothetical protein
MFRNLILSLIALQSATIMTAVAQATSQKVNYLFDQDASGTQCQKTIDENDDETFRLFCINKARSFKLCSVSCSNALHFEGTVGECNPRRCSFYGHNFETAEGKKLPMSRVAQGKVTFVGIVPLWQAQAQYFYELMDHVKSLKSDRTEAMILPLYVEDKEPVSIKPKEGEEVTILKTIQTEDLMSHSFMSFLRSLKHTSGFETFDIYLDRPVFFAISHDGSVVERMVAPTKDTLLAAVEKYSKGYMTSAEM